MTGSCIAVKKPSVSANKSAFVSHLFDASMSTHIYCYYYYYYYYYYFSVLRAGTEFRCRSEAIQAEWCVCSELRDKYWQCKVMCVDQKISSHDVTVHSWWAQAVCGGVWSVRDPGWPRRFFIPLETSTSGHFLFQLKMTKPKCVLLKLIFWPTDTTTGLPVPSTSFPVHCSLLVPSIYRTDSSRVCARRRQVCDSSCSSYSRQHQLIGVTGDISWF